MISPKLAILMATMAVIGAAGAIPMAPMALAQDQEAEIDIERNNEISQSIEQKQDVCANRAELEIDDDDFLGLLGNNRASLSAENICLVDQSQEATNTAAIVDNSDDTFDIDTSLVPPCRNLPPDLVIPSFCLPT